MSFAVSVAIQQTLMETALHSRSPFLTTNWGFSGLLMAVAWPVAILSCASVLDNPWNVCIARSAEVSQLQVILKKLTQVSSEGALVLGLKYAEFFADYGTLKN